jgi:hypothetical protein
MGSSGCVSHLLAALRLILAPRLIREPLSIPVGALFTPAMTTGMPALRHVLFDSPARPGFPRLAKQIVILIIKSTASISSCVYLF